MVDHRRVVFACTLAFSVVLEAWVRWVMPYTHGVDGFGYWPPVDNIMHFFWGLNIFLFLILFVRLTPKEGFLGVYAWQMAWEALEMVGDIAMGQPAHMADHLFMDGIVDTLVDLAGACLAWFLLSRSSEKFAGTRAHPRFVAVATQHLLLLVPLLPIGISVFILTGASADVLAIVWIVAAAPLAYVLAR